MPRRKKDRVPSAIRVVFESALAQMTPEPVALPDPLWIPTSVSFMWDWGRERNRILKVSTGRVGERCYLDYFLSCNDGETSSHGRIHEDGREEGLENYEWQVSRPTFATPEETERVAAHNAEVTRVLKSKGFIY